MRSVSIVFCVFVVLLSVNIAQATIIHVPTEQSTIQAGIYASVNGDTLLVAPGTYYENINFYGKAILLKSQAGAESTIISKLYDGLAIVTFRSNEDSNSIIDGFTIQNAKNTSGYGGGVYCENYSSPTIRNNIIKGNIARYGGGIACRIGCSPLIQNNRIETDSSYIGGGIYCYNQCSPTISNNNLIANTADEDGGGVYCDSWCSPVVSYNLLICNRAFQRDGAGLEYLNHCSGVINYNLLVENTGNGVGALCFFSSSPVVSNNTLDRNSNHWPSGGSIFCDNSSPNIINTIVSNEQYSYGIFAQNLSYPTITYSDVWNNATGNYFACMPGQACISSNPVFCDTASDNYYLSGGSPCVGAGEGGVDIGAFGIGCGSQPYAVLLTSGSNKSGRAQTTVQVEFYVRNMGFLSDTYDLNITDSLGWTIVPTNYIIPLDSAEMDTASFTVSIPYVPIGTVDRLRLTAVSQADTSIHDIAYLTVTCNAIVEGVEVTPGSNQNGYADSIVSIAYLVKNVGVVRDSYNLQISDTRGWQIIPLQYKIVLDTGQTAPVSFIVSIPYVPLGTTDQLTLLAVSKTNPLARDSASLNVTCSAYKEAVNVVQGANQSGGTHTPVQLKFFIQNTGFKTDTYDLNVIDPFNWVTSPLHYQKTLNHGQLDSLNLSAFIPNVPLGTVDFVKLTALSLSNPYVSDSDSLSITCINYTIDISGITDVPNDQGKQVRLKWFSFTDTDQSIKQFTIFRRIDSLLIIQDKELLYPPGNWEAVSTIPAYGETLYAAIAPTLKDSTIAEGMHYSVFFVRAGTDNPYVHYDSPIDSGYSLDNLFPSPPTGLVASHQPAATQLLWHPTSSPDFDYYTIYRDTSAEITPAPDRKLAYSTDTAFVDSTSQLGRTYYYVTSASDFSGNESSPSNEAAGVRYMTGDANADGVIDVGDIVCLINYLFKNGPAPTPLPSGDCNCDGNVDVGDVVYLINYLFKSGPPPSC